VTPLRPNVSELTPDDAAADAPTTMDEQNEPTVAEPLRVAMERQPAPADSPERRAGRSTLRFRSDSQVKFTSADRPSQQLAGLERSDTRTSSAGSGSSITTTRRTIHHGRPTSPPPAGPRPLGPPLRYRPHHGEPPHPAPAQRLSPWALRFFIAQQAAAISRSRPLDGSGTALLVAISSNNALNAAMSPKSNTPS